MQRFIERQRSKYLQKGKLGYVLAWALGVPIPILAIVFLVRGCN
jgi:hypothetical protein